jgi:hypothetical protein
LYSVQETLLAGVAVAGWLAKADATGKRHRGEAKRKAGRVRTAGRHVMSHACSWFIFFRQSRAALLSDDEFSANLYGADVAIS